MSEQGPIAFFPLPWKPAVGFTTIVLVLVALLGCERKQAARAEVLDLGKVAARTVIESGFEIQNPSKKTIEIERLEASCGCMVVSLETKRIPPAGKIYVPLRISAPSEFGSFEHEVTVDFVGNTQAAKHLRVTGVVDGSIVGLPERIDFGPVEAEKAGAGNVSRDGVIVCRENCDSFASSEIFCDNDYVSLDLSQRSSNEASVLLTLKPDIPYGRSYGRILCRDAARTATKEALQFVVSIVGEVDVTPTEVYFRPTPRGQIAHARVAITLNGKPVAQVKRQKVIPPKLAGAVKLVSGGPEESFVLNVDTSGAEGEKVGRRSDVEGILLVEIPECERWVSVPFFLKVAKAP